jgi:hypothetical protein
MRVGLQGFAKSRAFKAFSRYHGHYWWFFGASVLAHLTMAIAHTGLPAAGALDAGIHWIILGLGAFGAISLLSLFASCRLYPRLLGHSVQGLSVSGKGYRSFFVLHQYFWLAFALLLSGHFLAGYLHVGIWPT